MKILLHHSGLTPLKVIASDGEDVRIKSKTCIEALWELAAQFPEELIGWCNKDIEDDLKLESWQEVFHHDLIMASYAVDQPFFPESIGYVDLLPFAHLNREVIYGTWRMSSDVGGIKGEVLLKFRSVLSEIDSFSFLLNSVAKIGQQNGLFCYSNPNLLKRKSIPEEMTTPKATLKDLFQFVHMHYSVVWVHILFWCFLRYEKVFPFLPYISVLSGKSVFKYEIDFSEFTIQSLKVQKTSNSIDVILPTIGRPIHTLNVLEDLKKQSFVPTRVIVVEQNPDPEANSDLQQIKNQKWPFEIIHLFIRKTGACNARNLALEQVTSDYVFFCDDDNRMDWDLLKKTLIEMKRLGCDILNTAYRQPGEKIIFNKIKQWGTFGGGNSILRRKCLKDVWFSPIFEYGYGEDKDFGMQLRNKGWDIIYHPGLEIIHLKAAMGGFREKFVRPWEGEQLLPKPSPTVMALAKKYNTKEQMRGFKISLFLKFYRRQKVLNLFSYLRRMERQWQKSEYWASYLIQTKGSIGKIKVP